MEYSPCVSWPHAQCSRPTRRYMFSLCIVRDCTISFTTMPSHHGHPQPAPGPWVISNVRMISAYIGEKKDIFSNCVIVTLQACLLRHSKSYFLLHSLSYMISSMTILTLRLSLNFFSLLYERLCGFRKVSKWSMRSLAGKRHGSWRPESAARLNTAQSARRNTMKNLIPLIDSMGITALIGPTDLGTQGVTRPTLESGGTLWKVSEAYAMRS